MRYTIRDDYCAARQRTAERVRALVEQMLAEYLGGGHALHVSETQWERAGCNPAEGATLTLALSPRE